MMNILVSRRQLIAASPLLLAAAAAPHRSTSSISHRLSLAEERRLEPIFLKGYEAARGTAPSPRGNRIEAYLNKVGKRLTEQGLLRPISYTFHFDPDPGFKSAMALPGGAVVVGSGLLSVVDSEDALACVLGHEIKHCDLGHTTKRIFEIQDRDHISDGRRASINPLEFGRTNAPEDELAADREGIALAVRAGYSPYGVRRLLEFLAEVFKAYTPRPGALTIAHRIKLIDAQIAENGWQRLADVKHPLALPDWG